MPDRIEIGVKKNMPMQPISVELEAEKITPNKVRYVHPDDNQLSIYLLKADVGFPNHPQRIRMTLEAVH